MGGIGSGRHWQFGSKDTTNDYCQIDIRRWQRDGLLAPNNSYNLQWSRHGEVFATIQVKTEDSRVVLTYRHSSGGDQWKDESYPIYVDWTACNLGGQRPWFLCPALNCSRRVAILYGGSIFACRHCYQLAYTSQRETGYDRMARRADRIREKLRWRAGILNGNGEKPKGMHRNTFNRLTTQHDDFVQASLAGIAHRLNILEESIKNKGI
jgi:hypothetical protein